jgi:hypothetical protein
VLSDTELMSKMLMGVMYKCKKCNEDVYFDDKYKSKRGIPIPLDPDTGKYHKCKTTVHKRKGMLRVLNKTQIKYYRTLGLYPGATVRDIEDKFTLLIKEYHPDNIPKVGRCTCPKCDPKTRAILYKQVIEAHNNIRLIYVADE